MRAMGAKVGVEDVKNALGKAEVDKMVATGLNLNGHLCAELVEVRALRLDAQYEATCVTYGGGSSKKTYLIDALNGIAVEE